MQSLGSCWCCSLICQIFQTASSPHTVFEGCSQIPEKPQLLITGRCGGVRWWCGGQESRFLSPLHVIPQPMPNKHPRDGLLKWFFTHQLLIFNHVPGHIHGPQSTMRWLKQLRVKKKKKRKSIQSNIGPETRMWKWNSKDHVSRMAVIFNINVWVSGNWQHCFNVEHPQSEHGHLSSCFFPQQAISDLNNTPLSADVTQ